MPTEMRYDLNPLMVPSSQNSKFLCKSKTDLPRRSYSSVIGSANIAEFNNNNTSLLESTEMSGTIRHVLSDWMGYAVCVKTINGFTIQGILESISLDGVLGLSNCIEFRNSFIVKRLLVRGQISQIISMTRVNFAVGQHHNSDFSHLCDVVFSSWDSRLSIPSMANRFHSSDMIKTTSLEVKTAVKNASLSEKREIKPVVEMNNNCQPHNNSGFDSDSHNKFYNSEKIQKEAEPVNQPLIPFPGFLHHPLHFHMSHPANSPGAAKVLFSMPSNFGIYPNPHFYPLAAAQLLFAAAANAAAASSVVYPSQSVGASGDTASPPVDMSAFLSASRASSFPSPLVGLPQFPQMAPPLLSPPPPPFHHHHHHPLSTGGGVSSGGPAAVLSAHVLQTLYEATDTIRRLLSSNCTPAPPPALLPTLDSIPANPQSPTGLLGQNSFAQIPATLRDNR